MKKIFLLSVLILLFCTMSIAQQISLSDMIDAAKCKDKNCFNAFALQKHFFYFTAQSDMYSNTYVYTNDNNLNSTTAIDFSISFYKPPINQEISCSVGIRHNLKNYFLSILKQATALDYLPDKTVKDPSAYFGTITYHSKKNSAYLFNVTVRKDDRGLIQYFTEVEVKGVNN